MHTTTINKLTSISSDRRTSDKVTSNERTSQPSGDASSYAYQVRYTNLESVRDQTESLFFNASKNASIETVSVIDLTPHIHPFALMVHTLSTT